MYGWHFPMMLGGSGADWIVLLVLVIFVAAGIHYLARMPFFGGRPKSKRESLDESFMHGRVKFEEYEEAKKKHPHAHAH